MDPTSSQVVASASRQQQFLSVISRDEAQSRFESHLKLQPLGEEEILLADCRQVQGRVLSRAITAEIDVPGFDRSNVDGFALRSIDVRGAMEETPRRLLLNQEVLLPGVAPQLTVTAGTATPISTGGMIPRGADAVLMIEHSDLLEDEGRQILEVSRAVAPGEFITFAGSDIALGETVLWPGQKITSRELGVLAALGRTQVWVYRRPRVAVISTGDEVVSPGGPLNLGQVYDSNASILAAAVEELGGEAIVCGQVADDDQQLQQIVDSALHEQNCDVVVLSGGTSKGAGDLSYRVVSRFQDPGIVAHGVALKPGKPICLAVTAGKPVVVLPGFPTSAIFTFHEFVAPVIRTLAGHPAKERATVPATLPFRINSDRGRTEYVLTRLFQGPQGLLAYPIGKGSGSVTTFSQADGFLTIPQHTELLEQGQHVQVSLLDQNLEVPDLVVIGSHCAGLDFLTGLLRQRGFSVTSLAVGSQGGLAAAGREECDLAGCHLFDPESGIYNSPFTPNNCELVRGYRRKQCLVFRSDDSRFIAQTSLQEALHTALSDPECVLVNRNPGSGTRILLDQMLARLAALPHSPPLPLRPPGYEVQVKSHNAVAAAIRQRRADWGVAIETVARQYGLATLPWCDEHYDFMIPKSRLSRPAVQAFLELLKDPDVLKSLALQGFQADVTNQPDALTL